MTSLLVEVRQQGMIVVVTRGDTPRPETRTALDVVVVGDACFIYVACGGKRPCIDNAKLLQGRVRAGFSSLTLSIRSQRR